MKTIRRINCLKSSGFCLISSIPLIFLEEWARVDALIEEAGNPSGLERMSSEDLVRVKKYIEIAPSHVFTREISAKKPFTKEARKVMTENVKKSAYESLLGQSEKFGGNVAKFNNEDNKIFNLARSEVVKNASTQKPARLNKALTSYMRSIGQIVCGSVRATCFLVTSELVITNYHIYRMIKEEREKKKSSLPIDEERDAELENPYLDYKFFHLKKNELLKDREPLGPKVRNWKLSEGRVVILGHPEGKEMQEEVCVVVGYRAMNKRIRARYEHFKGVHMTNSELLHNTEDYQGSLSYDTTFFGGSSGSPVFEMNGYIVAMHTQGYTLERTQDDVPNQQENVPNPEHENVPNPEHENVPNPEHENVPNPEHENVPNPEHENVPNPEHENVPNPEHENVPNPEHENVPNPEHDDVPNPENENVLNQYENVPNPVQEDFSNQEAVPNQEQENASNQEQQNYLNEEQDIPNEEQENISGQSNTRRYSLMEFGVQFTLICRDVRHWHGDDVVRKIFPYYKLKPGKKPMDLT